MKTATALLLLAATSLGLGLLAGCKTSHAMPHYPVTTNAVPDTEDTQPGKVLYLQNCSACHGAGGHGDGPSAIAFCLPPPDLTRIAERNGGTFPYGEIVAVIGGERAIDAHGFRKMPVWGDVFQQSAQRAGVAEAQEVADGNLLVLASWLEEIQTYPIDEN